jgi:flagellar biosynthesis protein FlhA
VFLILVIIQFIVIVKGSGRISEVSARFTLDAMPGKQMAIDADLNSGLITEAEARQRRDNISREAEFFGAMDGASKFVKGDAIAGILINIINIIGGFIIGVVQKGMLFTDALQTYTMLTIGDGLVSQIPALIIATSAGMVVTRSAPFKSESARDCIRCNYAFGFCAGYAYGSIYVNQHRNRCWFFLHKKESYKKTNGFSRERGTK